MIGRIHHVHVCPYFLVNFLNEFLSFYVASYLCLFSPTKSELEVVFHRSECIHILCTCENLVAKRVSPSQLIHTHGDVSIYTDFLVKFMV